MAPIERLYGLLVGGLPFLEATVSKDIFRLQWRTKNVLFEEAPAIAIEHRNGKKFVSAVGHAAIGMEGALNTSVHNPFSSVEPLFADYDLSVALMQHAVRTVLSMSRAMLTPNLVLHLKERSNPISDAETKMLSKFCKRCGVFRIYVILGSDAANLSEPIRHKDLIKYADAMVYSKQ